MSKFQNHFSPRKTIFSIHFFLVKSIYHGIENYYPPLIVARRENNYCAARKKLLRGIFKIWILENNYCPFENNYCPFENNYCPFAKNYCASCQKIPRLAPSAREIFVILEVKPGYILSKFRAVGARKFCDFRGKIRRYFIKISRPRRKKILRF